MITKYTFTMMISVINILDICEHINVNAFNFYIINDKCIYITDINVIWFLGTDGGTCWLLII